MAGKAYRRVFLGFDDKKIERDISKLAKEPGWNRQTAERYVNLQKGSASGKIQYGRFRDIEL